LSNRAAPADVDPDREDAPRRLANCSATDVAPEDVACRELVGLLSDYLDGVLDPGWRAHVDEHLRHCDGCTTYLGQIRATVELLAQLDVAGRQPADGSAM
jgi:anti-sigma factor RsiW